MKKHIHLLAVAALLLIAASALTGCVKKYKIQVPTNNLWFGLDAGSQTFDFTANCEWTITKNDDADWYTISQMSGKKVFGVTSVEHWNTDYMNQMIEDSYKHKVYDPYDTATGYTMYFLADGTGVQMDHHKDTAVYYAFTYEYNPINQILHIEFETIDDSHERLRSAGADGQRLAVPFHPRIQGPLVGARRHAQDRYNQS